MRWRRISLRVRPEDVEPASAVLAAATGAAVAAVEVVKKKRPGFARNASGNDAPAGAVTVSAYVTASISGGTTLKIDRALASARKNGLLRGVRATTAIVADEDWAKSWKRFYEPARVAPGLYVVPSWRRSFKPQRPAAMIRLDPGMAFGTGSHPTTRLALRSVLRFAEPGETMLDIGCGSGILGIAAAMKGANVYASDSDPIAVTATRKNFGANRLTPAAVRRSTGVPRAFPRARLIAANITADVLERLAPAFAAKLKPGGAIVTSGVTGRGRAGMLRAFAAAGLRLEDERASREWLAFVHRRPRAKR